MCIIIDANVASDMFAEPPHADAVPIFDWLNRRRGKLVYGGQLAVELAKVEKARRWLRAGQQAGITQYIPADRIQYEQRQVTALGLCKSDDPHVIALARASRARILFTRDKSLIADFKNTKLISNPKGRVYSSRNNSMFLNRARCC
jgi:hypothetical protein